MFTVGYLKTCFSWRGFVISTWEKGPEKKYYGFIYVIKSFKEILPQKSYFRKFVSSAPYWDSAAMSHQLPECHVHQFTYSFSFQRVFFSGCLCIKLLDLWMLGLSDLDLQTEPRLQENNKMSVGLHLQTEPNLWKTENTTKQILACR